MHAELLVPPRFVSVVEKNDVTGDCQLVYVAYVKAYVQK